MDGIALAVVEGIAAEREPGAGEKMERARDVWLGGLQRWIGPGLACRRDGRDKRDGVVLIDEMDDGVTMDSKRERLAESLAVKPLLRERGLR